MPCLIPDVLYEIGKNFLEDNDSDSAYRFALSGKEPLKALKNVFSSVTTLELNTCCYGIRWGGKSSTIDFSDHNQLKFKHLVYCIGDSVRHLYINDFNVIFQPIIDKILLKKHTVKNLSIPNQLMTENLRDNLDLVSLKVQNLTNFQAFLSFCCKTHSLEFSILCGIYLVMSSFENVATHSLSPHLFSAKHLIFNEYDSVFLDSKMGSIQIEKAVKHFPAIESIKFIFKTYSFNSSVMAINANKKSFIEIITQAEKVPPKIILVFHKSLQRPAPLEVYKEINKDYDYDENINNVWCFRKTIHSANKDSTALEIQILK